MADGRLHSLSPLSGESSERTPDPRGAIGVTVRERSCALVSVAALRGREANLIAAVRDAFGLDLPTAPKRVSTGEVAFIWAGSGKWLAQSSAPLDLAALPAAVVDQSDGRVVLRVAGPAARETLATLIPIDLHPRAFAPGDAALTHAATIAVHLWQLDDAPTYEIAAFRSYACTLWRRLAAAGRSRGVDAAIGG